MAHRDLKPENFLVKEDPFAIIITDFGLSEVETTDNHLKTFCGTPKYAAPEIFPGNSDSYGLSVDIWSTGVIMLEFFHGLPKPPRTKPKPGTPGLRKWSRTWYRRLLGKLDDSGVNNNKVIAILLHMTKIDPKGRFSEEECLEKGCDDGLFKRNVDGHIAGAYDTRVSTRDEATLQADSAEGPLQQTHIGTLIPNPP